MGSKRRRGIGIRKWLVTALQEYAKKEGIASHTAAFSLILRGQLAPLPEYEKYKNGDNANQDVSMQEELLLALKDYCHQREKNESTTKVASKVLVGMIVPIPPQSIEEGMRLARIREAEREANGETGKAKKKKVVTAKIEVEVGSSQEEMILQEREIEIKRVGDNGRPLSQGVPVREKPIEKKINPEDDSYGGVFNF